MSIENIWAGSIEPDPTENEDIGDAGETLNAAYLIELKHSRDVADEVRRLRVRKDAADLFKAENEPTAPGIDSGTLGEILARPADPDERVKGLVTWEGSTLIVGARKVGKTSLVGNLARSLFTGEPFLGHFEVRPVEGAIAILNYEVSAAMLARWAHDQGIDEDRFFLVNLRGRRNPLSHLEDRARLADDLRARNVETVIVDPFGRAFTGKNQNDSGEVGSFLMDLDLFARAECGAKDLILTAHAGWNGERSRGSSALEDWADSVITLTRDPDDEAKRFFKAFGRDVEIEEDALNYDHVTRSLSLSGTGSRKKGARDRKTVELIPYTVRAAKDEPGISVAGLERAIREMEDAPSFQPGEVSQAAKRAAIAGLLHIEGGGKGKKTSHFPTPYNPLYTPSKEALKEPLTPYTPYIDIGVGVGGLGAVNEFPTLEGVKELLGDFATEIEPEVIS